MNCPVHHGRVPVAAPCAGCAEQFRKGFEACELGEPLSPNRIKERRVDKLEQAIDAAVVYLTSARTVNLQARIDSALSTLRAARGQR